MSIATILPSATVKATIAVATPSCTTTPPGSPFTRAGRANSASGEWANAFYSAAVQAGAQNWKAFFFGSFDAANGITVDKAPAALWVMELSVRLFGLSNWSILLPQALMGVATVGVASVAARNRVKALFEGVDASPRVAVYPPWFHPVAEEE